MPHTLVYTCIGISIYILIVHFKLFEKKNAHVILFPCSISSLGPQTVPNRGTCKDRERICKSASEGPQDLC